MTTVDSYSETNQNATLSLKGLHPSSNSNDSAVGNSFACGSTLTITSAKFYLKKSGSPTGNAHAVLYAHSGTYGSSSVPTGDPLATSDDYDVSNLTTDFQLITFTFTGAEQYAMQADTKYCIAFENPASGTIDSSNYVQAGADASSPTHDGNYIYFDKSSWTSIGSYDLVFYVINGVVVAEIKRRAAVARKIGLPTVQNIGVGL